MAEATAQFAAASVPGVETEGATTRHLAKRPLAAVMVIKRQAGYLAVAVVQMKLK